MAKRKGHFNVAPVYSGGSPAQVDEQTTLKVAKDEQEGYERHIEGAYGPQAKQDAEKRGLSGIVEQRFEKSSGWYVLDLITGERSYRQFKQTPMLRAKEAIASRNWILFGKQ